MNGAWTYDVVLQWGKLPAGKQFGGTHGAISSDKAGDVYISNQSETGVLVYEPGGRLVKTIALEFPRSSEDEDRRHGSAEITAPGEAGFKQANEWRVTGFVPGPDGSIYIASGYDDSRIFRFDKHGNYQSSFSGKGTPRTRSAIAVMD